MSFVEASLARTFGHPRGIFGRIGGMIMARENRRMARKALRLLDVQPHERVLEIGFGPGVGIRLLARSPARSVAGIDPSQEMVEQAQTRNAGPIEAGRVVLERSSVERLPYPDATFDKAMAVRSLQVWPDAIGGLREILRVLRPGGVVVVGLAHGSGQTGPSLVELLDEAGFAEARSIDARRGLFARATRREALRERPGKPAA